jgi:hypothetical protein
VIFDIQIIFQESVPGKKLLQFVIPERFYRKSTNKCYGFPRALWGMTYLDAFFTKLQHSHLEGKFTFVTVNKENNEKKKVIYI